MGNWIGARLDRKEDRFALTGKACYVADLQWEGMLHAAFLRSPHAHARIRSIDTARASQRPGVVGVWTGEDLHVRHQLGWLKSKAPEIKDEIKLEIREVPQPLMALHRVQYVGQPVAVVVAQSRYEAEDALDEIAVEYEPLPATVEVEGAGPDSVLVRFELEVGDVAQGFRDAAVVVRDRFRVNRHTAMPMETRGVAARQEQGILTVWSSEQVIYKLRDGIAAALHLPEGTVRVVAADIGGGFGVKVAYGESIVVPWLARQLNRPVRWIEDRKEHFASTNHSREQVHEAALGLDREGRIVALQDQFLWDCGICVSPTVSILSVPYNTACHMMGQYRVPNYACAGKCISTNKTPSGPYRGSGRPEAVLVMERLLEKGARALGIDPVELRRRNLVTSAEMPYDTGMIFRNGIPIVYDVGDYPEALETAVRAMDYGQFRAEQESLRRQGTYRGIGFATCVESTGAGRLEGAIIRVDREGKARVLTGAVSQGQGHATTLAQVCADVLGLAPDDVTVLEGDTDRLPYGEGTYGNRTAIVAGNAVYLAAQKVLEKAKRVVAHSLEVAEADLEVGEGRIHVRGLPARGLALGEVAARLAPGHRLPEELGTGLEATAYFLPRTVVWSSATHAVRVEVDVETGLVKLLKVVVVHDCGRQINPKIVDGQVRGGVAQGIGGALYEELAYDEHGQLLTSSFLDYLLPGTQEVPNIEVHHQENPSPENPLGVKGAGEGGLIAVPAAIVVAVEDALTPFGVSFDRMPLSPDRVWRAIAAARAQRAEAERGA